MLTRSNRRLIVIAISLSPLLLLGCGPGEPFTHAHIHGKVTYDDGSLIEADRIIVQFHPLADPKDPKTHPRTGQTDLNPDGTFANVTSHRPGDGIVVGKHKVTLIPLDENERELKVIPREYMSKSTTPLEIDTEDFSDDNPYHLKVEKPLGVR